MEDFEQIPTPDSSGNAGAQIKASNSGLVPLEVPFEGLPLAAAVQGIAAKNTKAFGGDVSAALIAAAAAQMAQDNHDLKVENRRLGTRNEDLRDELDKSRTRVAVLEDRAYSETKSRHVRNFSITLGMGLVGVGFTRAKAELDAYAAIAMIAGALLVLVGWLSGPKAEVEK